MQTKVLQLPTQKNLKVNQKFKNLLRPLTEIERNHLTISIKRDGVIDPIRYRKAPTGELEIIDGHNRFEIATSLNKDFEIHEVKFQCPLDEAVMYWMYQHQSARRGGDYAQAEMARLMIVIKQWSGENATMASAIRQVAVDTDKSEAAVKKAVQRSSMGKQGHAIKSPKEQAISVLGKLDRQTLLELMQWIQDTLDA